MSLKVIEFNDAALKVGDESGILLQSPGFALSQNKKLQLGEVAEQQARVHPTNAYNKFWHDLSMDPLTHGNGIRHHADIAYAHLMHLAENAGLDGDVIFAVPGNFTRQQLAILLGLSKQCPFNPIGVVDSALAAAVASAAQQSLIYADIQLHQVLLTKLKVEGGKVKVDSVIQVPGVGSQNFMDLMMQFATSAFIQQSRFNPQHNAEIEQQLYNALPHWWLQNNQNESSLVLELKANNTVHTAKIPRESLVSTLSGHYLKINQQIASLASSGSPRLLLSTAIAALPGFKTLLGANHALEVIEPETVINACLHHREHIAGGEQGLHLVSSLAVADAGMQSPAPSVRTAQPERATHVLWRNTAQPLTGLRIENKPVLNGSRSAPGTLELSLPGLPAHLGDIQLTTEGVFFDSGANKFLLNRKWVSGRQALTLGDSIQFAPDTDAIALIKVSNE